MIWINVVLPLFLFIFYNIRIYAFLSTTLPRLIIDLLCRLGMYRYSTYLIYDFMNTFFQELNIELPAKYLCNLLSDGRTSMSIYIILCNGKIIFTYLKIKKLMEGSSFIVLGVLYNSA